MVTKRVLITLLTLLIIGVAAAIAIFLAKGYRISQGDKVIAGTGILSITSVPDQASVYLDGHLSTATNSNINSLPPKQYEVRILKEGYIPWEKKVEVKQGLVTEVKATLFRAIPTVYPLTYTGVTNLSLSPDDQKLVYVVPGTDKKSGVWVWQMSEKAIALARGSEPHQIALPAGLDYSKAKFKWSPDSSQVLATFDNQQLLLDSTRLNDPPRDITAVVTSTLKSWDEDQKTKDLTRLELIKDLSLRKTASSAALLKWSPDETKILYSTDGKTNFKVVDLLPKKSYDLPQALSFNWLPGSQHLFLVEGGTKNPAPQDGLLPAKISVIEYDGLNRSEIFAGNFDPNSVFVWPDGSRLVIVSSLPIATANLPNLFGINLK